MIRAVARAFALAIMAGGLASAAAVSIAASPSPDAPAERTFDLHIEGGKLAADRRVVRVKQHDAVRLRWTSTAPAILHLHGYDIELRVDPGAVVEMAFKAFAAGRFPVHAHSPGASAGGGHRHGAPLAYVEVRPP